MRNSGLKYICKQIYLRTETSDSPFTHLLHEGEVLKIPIGHMEGNYFCDAATLKQLEAQRRIAFRYSTATGRDYGRSQSQRFAAEYCRHPK